ncbi:Kef-type K+ transport system, membrane component KefB [Nocardia amikacinitolerans]|uniref:cation:proton antiporter n=1 Tax=Nocardia amikacinitolerans TaxID=756689 RepID=UPI00082C51C2|nr:cation:proton antiporter [Nocardia amikacinitolerans]MCP2314742.1 Kef-type K+ transport system, membrane component KefB [Nocardia amikacinitolerans]
MSSNQTLFLLLDLVLIMICAHTLGSLAERMGQPAVIGEIAAGILAGPTILGAELSGFLFPHEVRSYLSAFANVGVLIFMFLAGLEIDRDALGGHRKPVAAVALSAFLAPFALACAVAPWALARHSGADRLSFTLFIGCALAVTAFPVLARILHDRGLFRTRIGQVSMAGAALDDLLAWSALAVVIGLAQPEFGARWQLLLIAPLLATLWWVARPVLAKAASSGALAGRNTMLLMAVCGALLCGMATEWLGLHLIFGAFVFGLAFPRSGRLAVEGGVRLLSGVFLPAFFVVAGLQVDFGALDRASIGELLAIMGAALVGKLGGVYLAARCTGIDRRAAAAVASLMNTRGLTELVILNVGLATGLLGERLYSLLVLMALLSTAMTAPLLRLCGVARMPRPLAHAN